MRIPTPIIDLSIVDILRTNDGAKMTGSNDGVGQMTGSEGLAND